MGPLTDEVPGGESEAEASEGELSEARSELSPARVEWLRLSQDPQVGCGDSKLLSLRLVHQFLRRTEFRGSDVRLDLPVLYKPDAVVRTTINPNRWVWKVAQSYPWKCSEHINVLELRAILRMLEWRARSGAFHSKRFLHLTDSQICVSVLTKGRRSVAPASSCPLLGIEFLTLVGLDCFPPESGGRAFPTICRETLGTKQQRLNGDWSDNELDDLMSKEFRL